MVTKARCSAYLLYFQCCAQGLRVTPFLTVWVMEVSTHVMWPSPKHTPLKTLLALPSGNNVLCWPVVFHPVLSAMWVLDGKDVSAFGALTDEQKRRSSKRRASGPTHSTLHGPHVPFLLGVRRGWIQCVAASLWWGRAGLDTQLSPRCFSPP